MAVPQKMAISLSGTVYRLTLVWNSYLGAWVMDLADASLNPIVQGVPLVTGALLLAQYAYLGFPGDLFVQSTGNSDDPPTFDGLGNTSFLYYAPGVGAGAPVPVVAA